MQRRAFLQAGAISLLGLSTRVLPEYLLKSALASQAGSGKTLVVVFQRGAMDGLMAVQPFSDKHFLDARSRLRMTMSSESGLIQLNDRFALHPAFASFAPLYESRKLAIVHGIGSPDSSRSHFDAQDYMETGTPGQKSSVGWLNRAAASMSSPSATQRREAFECISASPALSLSLSGPHSALAIDDLSSFRLRSGNARRTQNSSSSSASADSFEALYAQSSDDLLRSTGRESFEASRMLDSLLSHSSTQSRTLAYPNGTLARHFQDVAKLIKADVGLRIAFIESGGWDTHVQQGTRNGQFARTASEFAQCISTFWEDLGLYQSSVCLMTMTEFGRTVRENGSGGTDHGRASCMFVLSDEVNGGKVLGTVPELAQENLADGRDLPVTTDFRSLFSEVAHHQLNIPAKTSLFPAWDGPALQLFRS